jgi:hypothetical protein
MAHSEVLTDHSPGGMAKSTGNLYQNNRRFGRDSNQTPPEYKLDALPIEANCSVLNTVSIIKPISRMFRWTERVAFAGQLRDLNIYEWIVLKWILEKQYVKMWQSDKKRVQWRDFINTVIHIRVP